MRTQFRSEPNFAEMFMMEAKLAARLSHPNIVQTNEVFDYEGLPVIVMEYLEGQPLSVVINKSKGTEEFPREMHLRCLSECLSALEYSHNVKDFEGNTLGLVHRDVSPHNVFLTYDGQVKLLDFGIAKLNTSQVETATGVIKGKLRYMPPEQITGDRVDCRADIYAVGVMLWEAATGKKMWAQASEANIMNAVLNEEIPTPSSMSDDVDDELERIVMKAMSSDPEDRYQTAAEMQAELDAYLSTLGSNLRVRDIGKVVTGLFSESRDATQKIVNDQLARVAALSDADAEIYQPIELTGVTGTMSQAHNTNAASVTQTTVGAKSAFGIALLGGLIGAVLLAVWQLKTASEKQVPVVAPQVEQSETDAKIQIRITGFPATAQLSLDGKPLPSNPYTRTFDRSKTETKELKVTAPGHEDAIRTIPMDQHADVVVTLRALPEEPKPKEKADPAPRTYRPRAYPTPAPVAKPKVNCDPPYYIDERGVKKFKTGCL